jgi:hypothetical protein
VKTTVTLEEALPLVRALSADDKLRLIDELARELLSERRAEARRAEAAGAAASPLAEEPSAGPPDEDDESRWTGWLATVLDGAAARIAEVRREMQERGILDASGALTSDALPPDMTAGSRTSVATG